MNLNSNDSAATRKNPDDTVWPPPPTGPRAVAVRLPGQSFFFLPLPKVMNRFRVPKWAKSSGNCLLLALATSRINLDSPIFVDFLLGGLLILDSLLVLSFLSGAGMVLYACVTSAVTRQGYSPTKADDKYFTPNVWLVIFPHLIFFAWASFSLFSSYRHLVNRIALAFWLALIAASLGVAIVSGVNDWLVSRLEGGRHPGR